MASNRVTSSTPPMTSAHRIHPNAYIPHIPISTPHIYTRSCLPPHHLATPRPVRNAKTAMHEVL
ncbi:hypothetical protein HBH56_083380 [Parastagonospora nodorum]|nr:hypothetical protein HBH56_083380 [Parastagonospora nodorum]KAH6468752.1 hypothetical protein HBI57_003040 [Parastagonospora nodorum]